LIIRAVTSLLSILRSITPPEGASALRKIIIGFLPSKEHSENKNAIHIHLFIAQTLWNRKYEFCGDESSGELKAANYSVLQAHYHHLTHDTPR